MIAPCIVVRTPALQNRTEDWSVSVATPMSTTTDEEQGSRQKASIASERGGRRKQRLTTDNN